MKSTEKVSLGKTTIHYKIVRSKRKTLGIKVGLEEGVIVRAPTHLPVDVIRKKVQEKGDWILQKLEKMGEIEPKPAPKEFMSGEKLPYLGRRYRLKVNKENNSSKEVDVRLYRGKFYIGLSSQINESERRTKIRQALIKWYRSHAQKRIAERVEKYQSKIGVTPAKVKVKHQKKRWGSCSNKRNLNFNWRIIMAPISLVDYVVVHELTHLKYPHHSKEFWDTIASILPDYKERRERLRVKGNTLEF